MKKEPYAIFYPTGDFTESESIALLPPVENHISDEEFMDAIRLWLKENKNGIIQIKMI